jgi:NADH-ubiquinone oxidoreductase chain 3
MTSTTFFFIFIPLLAIILLAVNLIFAPHNPYQEKNSAFECGFHSFLGQNRTQFSISFFIFALLFLLFDLEILLVYPYVVSAYTNGIYGLVIMLIFFLALTLGFAFELGKNALKIDSRQMVIFNNNAKHSLSVINSFILRNILNKTIYSKYSIYFSRLYSKIWY